MSLVRTSVAVSVAALSLFAATTASAAVPTGVQTVGHSYARSISKDDFGAGFQVSAGATATDYAQRCAWAESGGMCSATSGFFRQICMQINQSVKASLCQQRTGMGYSAKGSAGADATLFGKDLDLFDISAQASAEPTSTSASYGIFVLGQKIKGESYGGTFSKDVALGERTLATAASTFMLGPVPITVQASATGKLGIEFAMTPGTAKVSGTARPYVSVDGVFSAGLGTKGLSAGVTGSLLLVELGTPATASLAYNGNKSFSWDASLDLEIKSLDGSVGLYGEFLSWRKTWTIFSWEGLTYNQNLGRKNGSFTL